jgi:hypothetical protein
MINLRSIAGALFVGALAAVSPGCSPTRSELDIDAVEPVATSDVGLRAIGGDASLYQPSASQVREVLSRIFGTAVEVAGEREPHVIVADLNRDGSADMAIVVRARPQALSEINSEVASWIRVDIAPPSAADPLHRAAVAAEAGEDLLAIVHGYGPPGWRHPQARQTFLLRHAAGKGMKPLPLRAIVPRIKGAVPIGDVITESLGEEEGFLFWTGARYAFHARGADGSILGAPASPHRVD